MVLCPEGGETVLEGYPLSREDSADALSSRMCKGNYRIAVCVKEMISAIAWRTLPLAVSCGLA